MKTDNPYFNRFLQYACANLIACAFYFAITPLLPYIGIPLPEGRAADLLAASVTAIPFLLVIFVSTLRDKTLPRGITVRGYFAEIARTDLASFAVWAVLGALIAATGGSAGIAVFILIAQALPCTMTINLLGPAVGILAGALLNFALFLAVRVGAIALRK